MKKQRTLHTIGQAAEKLKLKVDHLKAQIRAGMPVEKDGGKIRVYLPDAEEWLAQRVELKRSFVLAMVGIDRLMQDSD